MTGTATTPRRSAVRLLVAILGAIVLGGVVLAVLAVAVLIVMLSSGGWTIG